MLRFDVVVVCVFFCILGFLEFWSKYIMIDSLFELRMMWPRGVLVRNTNRTEVLWVYIKKNMVIDINVLAFKSIILSRFFNPDMLRDYLWKCTRAFFYLFNLKPWLWLSKKHMLCFWLKKIYKWRLVHKKDLLEESDRKEKKKGTKEQDAMSNFTE